MTASPGETASISPWESTVATDSSEEVQETGSVVFAGSTLKVRFDSWPTFSANPREERLNDVAGTGFGVTVTLHVSAKSPFLAET